MFVLSSSCRIPLSVFVSLQIWSSNQAGSVAEIDIKANVCCAKYNPESMYKIAVGAADHTVHTYDLRKADKAVHVFRGMLTTSLCLLHCSHLAAPRHVQTWWGHRRRLLHVSHRRMRAAFAFCLHKIRLWALIVTGLVQWNFCLACEDSCVFLSCLCEQLCIASSLGVAVRIRQ